MKLGKSTLSKRSNFYSQKFAGLTNGYSLARVVANCHMNVPICHQQAALETPNRAMLSAGYGVGRARIATRKAQYQVEHHHLLMNRYNEPLTQAMLRRLFKNAKVKAIAENPNLASAIGNFWFYDLRAKAADDAGDERGAQDAIDLLDHDGQKTTSRHDRRRGTIVLPTR